ncbi:cold-shock protein [Sediminibacterium roseum]|uniref:Cold-shock protein n=1 Tax=Sediminibacterium roseum TaxID=1978412 RepID=A0ABW9ZVI3_9BACT|nr:cold-shock protein [Sediminibacterium roseum]NCI51182.1 cold-shock protein [Sediminibacterium roseum]
MATGTVKFFNETKGFGFIKDDSDGKEYFVHVTALSTKTLKENEKVSYEVEDGKKGPMAVRVQTLS